MADPNTLHMNRFRRANRWFPQTRFALEFVWDYLSEVTLMVGTVVWNTVIMGRFVFQGKLKLKHLLEQAAFVGWDTLGIALIMTSMSGMVLAMQLSQEMAKQGAGNFVGALVSIALLRELAPIMTGFSVIAMAGSAFSAELCSMQISKQVDALQVLHIHPLRYLILPRVLATVLVLPLMTTLTSIAGILGGMWISATFADIAYGTYLDSVWHHTEMRDVIAALVKSAVFGYCIAILSATIGIQTKGGAKEVGTATTRAVVWSFVAMAIIDYFITYLIYGTDGI